MRRSLALLSGLLLVLGGDGWTHAGTINAEIWENVFANGNNATIANQPAGAPDAMFNPASIDFNSSVTGYSIGSFFNNPVFFNTSGTFSSAHTMNNTYTLFTGQTFLHAGANNFVTPHDDGFELRILGAFSDVGLTVPFDFSQPGPTAPVNTPYTVYAAADGNYSFTLSYGEVLGAPAVLRVIINDAPVTNDAPEPASLTLLGIGIAGFAVYGWRRRKTTVSAAC